MVPVITWSVVVAVAVAVEDDHNSHPLRKLCPVTIQTDAGSLANSGKSTRIDLEALSDCNVSYGNHDDSCEACVERMFMGICERCLAECVTIQARYHRRVRIDMNPFRSDSKAIG